MDAMSAARMIRGVQSSLQYLTILHLTDYLYPEQADVNFYKRESIPCYDVIIAGGGTAGCVLASRLAEDGKTRVLLIEAGGNPPASTMKPVFLLYHKNTTIDWKYTAQEPSSPTCKRNPNIDLSIGKVLGGTSTLNYLIYSEGGKKDYDNWATIVNDSSWNAESVLPYFIKSQQLQDPVIEESSDGEYFGYDGNIILTKDTDELIKDFYKVFDEAGFTLRESTNIENPVGFSPALYNIGNGVRQSTAYTYISPKKDASNLHVLRNAMVTKIIFNKSKRAVAVEVLMNKKIIRIKANLEIVVSAGALNTPKLLMNSGIGPKSDLQSRGIKVVKDLPVGKNLQYQLAAVLVFRFKNTPGNTKPLDPGKYPAGVIVGFGSLNNSDEQPDYQAINYFNYASYLSGYSYLTYEFNDNITNTLFSPYGKYRSSDKYKMLFTVLTNLNTKTRGEVSLPKNYEDQPSINVSKSYDSDDMENMVKYIKDFFKIVDTPTYKSLGGEFLPPELKECDHFEKYSKEYWACYAKCMISLRPLFGGTTAMGSVVDSRLRVLGVKGLRVVDAGIMPVLVRSVLLGAVVMIAEKAADMIKEDNNL